MPVMVLSGGCIWLLLPRDLYNLPPSDCCRASVIDDASYGAPPYNTFWSWFPRVAGGYSIEVDASSIQTELRKQSKDTAGTTASAFLSSLGMLCRLAASDTQCERSIPAFYVCEHFERRLDDRNVRHEGRLRLVIWVSSSDVVKGAESRLLSSVGEAPCPQARSAISAPHR